MTVSLSSACLWMATPDKTLWREEGGWILAKKDMKAVGLGDD